MKKIFKIGLLVACCAVFSSVCYANTNQDASAKMIADGAKKSLLKQYKKFPIKLDNFSSLTDITSDKQYVVYDYKILMPSDNFTTEILSGVLKTTLKGQVCTSQVFMDTFKEYDLRFLYRYQFSDTKTITITLSVDEICD